MCYALRALCPSLRPCASGAHDGRSDRFRPAQPAGVSVRGGAGARGGVANRRVRPRSLVGRILLLPIGVTGLWAAVFHLFFPQIAAADIGWEVSPFQFEVGLADFAIGATACASFWRSLDFRAAAVLVSSIFLLGDAVGHVGQMIVARNFAPGNAGVPFTATSPSLCLRSFS